LKTKCEVVKRLNERELGKVEKFKYVIKYLRNKHLNR
jgi:hypothetical protein